jgi:hypothetical protein
MQLDSLREQYSLMSDDELLALEADADSLSAEARPVLSNEIRRRNLWYRSLGDDAQGPETPQSTLAKSPFASSLLRVLLCALLISFVLKLLGLPLEINLPGTLMAFFVGYYIYLRRQTRTTK